MAIRRPWHPPRRDETGCHRCPLCSRFLNTSKYPASLSFLLMTLGPDNRADPMLEGMHALLLAESQSSDAVPFFFYMLHIPLIHALA